MFVKGGLVIGSGGQLAKALKHLAPEAVFTSRDELDLANPGAVRHALERYEPTAVINAAAYTQVDKAESEEALATRVNAESPGVINAFCAERAIPFVHFSTDYVFDGTGTKPWRESDKPAPLNAYGRSKLAGEVAVAKAGGKYLIFRTSWVYDAQGKNFVNTMLRLAGEREELRVIADQYGAPTYAAHLAEAALAALQKASVSPRFPSGIYHMCNSGVTSWHGFATRIVEEARRAGLQVKAKTIIPIQTLEYPLPAARPHNSRLDCTRLSSIFGISLPAWEDGLTACMEAKREGN